MPVAVTTACSLSRISNILSYDPAVRILAVTAFAEGDTLPSNGATSKHAVADLCMVKLLIGPGTPGPAAAPSTQAGVGIEIWLPSPRDWTGRIHNVGGAAFMGLPEITAIDRIGPGVSAIEAASSIAGTEGAVSGITDAGHATPGTDTDAYMDGSFLLNPDGTIDTAQWAAFSETGIHELAVRTKQLVRGYYGRDASHAYFEGCSTGGRQAHKYAQRFPSDYDGIVAGASGINWTRFLTNDLYQQVVMQRELGGPISPAKLNRISGAAVSACDARLSGLHDGYISDPTSCAYDPTRDKTLLCRADGGDNGASDCISGAEARTVNALWYGQTGDGSSGDPVTLASVSDRLDTGQLWFGPLRGTDLTTLAGSKDGLGAPFAPAAHMVAFELGRNAVATKNLKNAAGNGNDAWKDLSLAEMATASRRGQHLQVAFSQIDTDDANLTAFKQRGGKMIAYHGLADQIVPPRGSFHYYRALEKVMNGRAAVDSFYRLFPIAGMGHCSGVGTVDGLAGVSPRDNPPLPESGQFYRALVSWVEQGRAPAQIVVHDPRKRVSRPLCRFPSKIKYVRGDPTKATSFRCEG